MTDNREWRSAKFSHRCPLGHFPALRADLCDTHRDNRSEIHMSVPGVHHHGHSNRHSTRIVQRQTR
jgi:hypothetical protein